MGVLFRGISFEFPSIFPGASIPPETMMHFPLFQISPISENFRNVFQTPWKISPILPFPPKISDFDDLSPFLGDFLFPPTFADFLHDFVKFTCFLHTLFVFRFPASLTMMHLCITQCTYELDAPVFVYMCIDLSNSNTFIWREGGLNPPNP